MYVHAQRRKSMLWYETVFENIENKTTYSHKTLIDELKILKPDLSDSTYHWALTVLVHSGKLTRMGYDSYALSTGERKEEYVPNYSDTSLQLIKLISEKYPYIQFDIGIYISDLENEYISLTDIAKYRNSDDPRFVIQNWMRNRNTVEFLGLWEELHNPDFNRVQLHFILGSCEKIP